MKRFEVESGTMKTFVSAKDVVSAVTKAIKKTNAKSLGLVASCIDLEGKGRLNARTYYVSTVKILEKNNMLTEIPPTEEELPTEQTVSCECGIVLNLENLRSHQFNSNLYVQSYACPVCRETIPNDSRHN